MPPFYTIAKPAQSLLGLNNIIHFLPVFTLIPRHYIGNFHSTARFLSSLPCSFPLPSPSRGANITPQRRTSHHKSHNQIQQRGQQLNPMYNLIQAIMDAPKDPNSNSASSPASSCVPPNASSAGGKINEISASAVSSQLAEPNSSSGSGSGSGPQEPAAQLPALTPAEFKTYNRLAVQMDYFHDHFRSMWKVLYSACTANRRPANLSLRQFIEEGLRLTKYLEGHHSIEETYLYPILARKMPQFASHSHSKRGGGKKSENALLKQHGEIHRGMDVFEDYLNKCKSGETELELAVLKVKMDSWGEVLFQHLDDEVRELEADVMRRYWTLAEIKSIPI